MPRPNGYQSLHTSVIAGGQPFEVQIRTEEMHRIAEEGIAAHWKYKDGKLIADSREVFGGPLTQITLLATKPTKEKNPTLFKAVANALDESIKAANADKRAAALLWKDAQKAPDNVDDLVAQLNDPGFEFTSQPRRIAYFADFLNRTGTMKAKLGDWKELFWETAHQRQGD